jgi:hypothetical protein
LADLGGVGFQQTLADELAWELLKTDEAEVETAHQSSIANDLP